MSWEDDNFANPQLLIKKKHEQDWNERRSSNFKNNEVKLMGVNCSWCGNECKDCYYKCIYHRKVFCEDCTQARGDIDTKEFAKCLPNALNTKECIWEKQID